MNEVDNVQARIDAEVDAVLFGCDGVVVDSVPSLRCALRDALAANEIDLSDDEVRDRFIGRPISDVVAYAKNIGIALPADFRADFEARYMTLARGNLRVLPGAMMLIGSLSTRALLGLVTTGSLKRTSFTLAQIGFSGAFPIIVTADEVPRTKPHPDGLNLACKRINVLPKRTLVVDGSPAGVEAGIAAGSLVIGYPTAFSAKALLDAGAHHIIESLADLRLLLRQKGRTT